MRILHVTPFYEPAWARGGMARAAAGLARAQARRGHEVMVATAATGPADPAESSEEGVDVRRFNGPSLASAALFPLALGLRAFLRARLPRVDVVHLHGARHGLAWAVREEARRAERAYILQAHGTHPHHGQRRALKSAYDALLGAAIVRDAVALVAVSEAEARDLPRSAHLIPNGVAALPAAVREPGPGPRLLFVGNESIQKRAFLLPSLLEAVPAARLTLTGPFPPRFRERFGSHAARVDVLGAVPDAALAAAYASADLLVHPAVGEAFGLAPFEAALAGTPGIVAGGHGCGEWYGRAGGCVVPPDDVPALAEAVRVRLEEPARGRTEAQRVAEFARRNLTWDHAAAAIDRLYGTLAAGRGRQVA